MKTLPLAPSPMTGITPLSGTTIDSVNRALKLWQDDELGVTATVLEPSGAFRVVPPEMVVIEGIRASNFPQSFKAVEIPSSPWDVRLQINGLELHAAFRLRGGGPETKQWSAPSLSKLDQVSAGRYLEAKGFTLLSNSNGTQTYYRASTNRFCQVFSDSLRMLHHRTFNPSQAPVADNYRSYNSHRAAHIRESGFNAPSSVHSHHALPHEVRTLFKARDIDHNDPIYKTWLTVADHIAIHGRGGQYNSVWREFSTENPGATRAQIFELLTKLANKHGFDIGNYVMRANGSPLVWTEVPLRGGAGGGGPGDGMHEENAQRAGVAQTFGLRGFGAKGSIGGVGMASGTIKGLANSLEGLLDAEPVLLLQSAGGKPPFSNRALQQIIREVAVGVYQHDVLPVFSLHFNSDGTLYSVLAPEYRNTRVGQTMGMLDYLMKGFLNGSYFDESFINEWQLRAIKDTSKDSSRLIQFASYIKEHAGKTTYKDLRALVKDQGLDPSDNFQRSFQTSFRIIANNPIAYHDGTFKVGKGFDVRYTIHETAEYLRLVSQMQKDAGGVPSELAQLHKAYRKMANQIRQIMPLLPMTEKYFNALGVIHFVARYFSTLKQMQKVPVLEPVKPFGRAFPGLLPPLPIGVKNQNYRVQGGCGLELPDAPLMLASNSPELAALKQLKVDLRDSDPETLVKVSGDYYAFKIRLSDYPAADKSGYAWMGASVYEVDAPNVQGRDELNWSAALNAIAKGDLDALQDVLGTTPKDDIRALLSATDDSGRTAMHWAASQSSPAYLGALLAYGAAAGAKDPEGFTPLHVAAMHGHIDNIEQLLDAAPNLVRQKSKNQSDALYIAVQHGHLAAVKLLHSKGASLTAIIDNELNCLHTAIHHGHEDVALYLLQQGLSPYSELDDGTNCLHRATELGLHQVIGEILGRHYQADVNKTRRDGFNPLMIAASKGDAAAVTIFLTGKKGLADSNFRGGSAGSTALHMAAAGGHQAVITLLLEHGANPKLVNGLGNTPLMDAIDGGQFFVARELLSKSPLDVKNAAKKSTLQLACEAGAVDLVADMVDDYEIVDNFTDPSTGWTFVHYLVQQGASSLLESLVPESIPVSALSAKDAKGRTPFELALQSGHAEEAIESFVRNQWPMELGVLSLSHYAARNGMLTYLNLAGGVEQCVQTQDCPEYGKSLAYIAAENGQHDVLKRLLAMGARRHYEIAGRTRTIYSAALRSGRSDCVELLSESECVIESKPESASRLHAAVSQDNFSGTKGIVNSWTARLLGQGDARINERDGAGKTALHIAAANQNFVIGHELIKGGADVDARDAEGETALALALKNNAGSSRSWVLASNNIQAEIGAQKSTYLHYAAGSGNVSIVQLLLSRGASLNTPDNNGDYPVHHAAAHGHFGVLLAMVAHDPCVLNLVGQGGNTVLHLLAAQKNELAFENFLDGLEQHGYADLSASTLNASGENVAQVAAMHGRLQTLQTVLADVDVTHLDNDGRGLLPKAANSGGLDVLRAVLDIPAACSDDQLGKAFAICAAKGDVPLLQAMVARTFPAVIRLPFGRTALHEAALSGHANAVKYLLESGGDQFLADATGKKPIVSAIENGHLAVASLLLASAPASVDDVHQHMRTLGHVAAAQGNVAMLALLIRKGLTIGQGKDEEGFTVLDHAAAKDSHELLSLMLAINPELKLSPLLPATKTFAGFVRAEIVEQQKVRRPGDTMLHVAARRGKAAQAYALCTNHDAFDARNQAGERAADVAVGSAKRAIKRSGATQ